MKKTDLKALGFEEITEYYQFILDNQSKLPQSILIAAVDKLSTKQKEECREHLFELLYWDAIDYAEDAVNGTDEINKLHDWFDSIGL